MKVAFVHDWLVGIGGAEKVLEALCELYDGPIYTLIKDKGGLSPFAGREIHTSFLQRLPLVCRYYQNLLPLFPLAIKGLDVSGYDLIISSSHSVAKAVPIRKGQFHICYCHTPMRYAWDLNDLHLKELGGLKGMAAAPILRRLREWDRNTHSSVDRFIANSHFVAERIKNHYGRSATVIYPPVDTHLFKRALKREEYYVTCSRLVPYKRVDILVAAFAKMKDKKLLIIGDGPKMGALKETASKNIQFLGHLPHDQLREVVSKAKAFLFSAEEEFGIAVVEAQAAAVPVIAYGRGGAVETIIDGQTGLLFDEQTPSSLSDAIENFERMDFDPEAIQKHAQKFSKERFMNEVKTELAAFLRQPT